MDGPELLIPLIAVVSIFIILPGMIFHYITLWRKQKTLLPDDERMLEDLWRSARSIERRIETIEQLMDAQEEEPATRRRRPLSPERFED
ncbi:MAG: envelope stress response membrane protein PspB [Pseudomonadota bacterium]